MANFRTLRGAAGLVATVATGLLVLSQPSTLAAPDTVTITTQAERGSSHADADAPLIIAHRGASGYRPEHTLAAYKLAIGMGADYIEPDLVSTKDGVLVARHENEISGTTDVADHPEFADRRTTKTIDGRAITGWFTEDFTLAELKTLRAKERLPDVRPANTRYDGKFQVPTFDEVLELVRKESKRRGEPVGVYPETKHPTYFDSIGLSLEEPLLRTLKENRLSRPGAKVFIQSFETANLRELDPKTSLPLVQLISGSGRPYDFVVSGDPRTYQDLVTPTGLNWIATYAEGIGPDKNVVIPRDENDFLLEPTDVVDDAHAEGLVVHVYTMRDENQFLPADFRVGTDPNAKGDAFGEDAAFFDAGVDGIFTDFADTGVAAREFWLEDQGARAAAR